MKMTSDFKVSARLFMVRNRPTAVAARCCAFGLDKQCCCTENATDESACHSCTMQQQFFCMYRSRTRAFATACLFASGLHPPLKVMQGRYMAPWSYTGDSQDASVAFSKLVSVIPCCIYLFHDVSGGRIIMSSGALTALYRSVFTIRPRAASSRTRRVEEKVHDRMYISVATCCGGALQLLVSRQISYGSRFFSSSLYHRFGERAPRQVNPYC